MKLDFNKKYNTIAVYSFIVICCSLVFYNILTNINDVKNGLNILTSTLQPFVIGFIIAYILNFILVFIEEKVLSKNIKKEKSKRAVSIISTYVIATFILYLFVCLSETRAGINKFIMYGLVRSNSNQCNFTM